MRLWSIHPRYLDAKGLVALWREGLLAQKVLLGATKGYKNHPQLKRFEMSGNPLGSIASYLQCVADEADKRHYRFDRSKIGSMRSENKIPVTEGQIRYEFTHLLNKLVVRDHDKYTKIKSTKKVDLHPLFEIFPGDIEEWEREKI